MDQVYLQSNKWDMSYCVLAAHSFMILSPQFSFISIEYCNFLPLFNDTILQISEFLLLSLHLGQ